MEQRTVAEAAHDNAARYWVAQARALGRQSRSTAGWVAVRGGEGAPGAHRAVVTRPYADAARLAAELVALHREWGVGGFCVEDPYGRLDLAPHGFEASLPQPVMIREPAPPAAGVTPRRAAGADEAEVRAAGAHVVGAPAAGVRAAGVRAVEVREAVDGDGLAVVERVVVEGFPLPGRQPWRRGALLPRALLGEPGWRAWAAFRDGAAAGSCVSYDDGSAVGLYWVATLPEHRSRGVARTLLEGVLTAHPGRPAVLTATLLGEPLYRRLGFTERAVSRWWRYREAPTAAGR